MGRVRNILVLLYIFGRGGGVPNKSDCSSKLRGGYETHQCYFIFLGGGYETYISVVTELRGTKHIRFGAK